MKNMVPRTIDTIDATPPIKKIDISATFCFLASFIREIMTAGSPNIRISVKALTTPVMDMPSRENPLFGRFPEAWSARRIMHVAVQRRMSVKVKYHAYRNHVVSIVNVRRYMNMIDNLMNVMENTYNTAREL